MLRAVVPQIMLPAVLVQPGPHIDACAGGALFAQERLPQRASARHQACRLDIGAVGPACRTMQILIRLGRVGPHHLGHCQADEAHTRDKDAEAACAQEGVRELVEPFAGPLKDAPGRIDLVQVSAEHRWVVEVVREELGGRLQPAAQAHHGQRRNEPSRALLGIAHLRPHRIVEPVFHRLLPFVLRTPCDVTRMADPTATRLRRLAVASSIASSKTSSPL